MYIHTFASVYSRVRKCIFTNSQVYIHAFVSVYSRQKCKNTPQTQIYAFFGVNIEAKQFTPKKCIFTPRVCIYTTHCVNIHLFWCFYRGSNLHLFWCLHNTQKFRVYVYAFNFQVFDANGLKAPLNPRSAKIGNGSLLSSTQIGCPFGIKTTRLII